MRNIVQMNPRLFANIVSGSMASISLVACGTMAAKIRSAGRLGAPYGRLVFALSVADVCQSLALITAPLLLPKGSPEALWAVGNQFTCNFTGFVLPFGTTAVCMYTCTLCIYYLCKLRFNYTDTTFYHKLEKILHPFIFLFNTVFCTAALATNSINPLPNADVCHFNRKPWNCDRTSSCERGQWAWLFTYIYTPIGTPLCCLVGITLSMGMLCWHVIKRERMFLSGTTGKTFLSRAMDRVRALFSKRGNQGRILTEQQPTESEVNFAARIYRRETMIQAILYVSVFFSTYGVAIFIAFCNISDAEVPTLILFVFVIVYPLGGLLNVLVYTRPSIIALRTSHSDLSWLHAFLVVVNAGGANPDSNTSHLSSFKSMGCCIRNCEDAIASDSIKKISKGSEGESPQGETSEPLVTSKDLAVGDDRLRMSSLRSVPSGEVNDYSFIGNKIMGSLMSSDLNSRLNHESSHMSSLTMDIALKSDVDPGTVAPNAFQRAYERAKYLVELAPDSEQEKNGKDNLDSLGNVSRIGNSNNLSGFSSFQRSSSSGIYIPGDKSLSRQSRELSTDRYQDVSASKNCPSVFAGGVGKESISANDHGSTYDDKSCLLNSSISKVPRNSMIGRISMEGSAPSTNDLPENRDESILSYESPKGLAAGLEYKGSEDKTVIIKKELNVHPSRGTDLAPVGIAVLAFKQALARANNGDGGKIEPGDIRKGEATPYACINKLVLSQNRDADSDDDDSIDIYDEEDFPTPLAVSLPVDGERMASTESTDNEKQYSMKVNNIVVADAFKKAFARAATRQMDAQEDDKPRDMPLPSSNFISDLSTLMEAEGDEED